MIDSPDPFGLRQCLIDWIGEQVRGRIVILTGSACGSTLLSRFFEDAGAARVHSFDLTPDPGLPLYIRLSRQQERIANPTPAIRASLDSLDPAGSAIVYAGSFTAHSRLCGREIIGKREQRQFEAERKDRQTRLTGSTASEVDLTNIEAATNIVQEAARRGPTVVSGIPDRCLALGASHTYLAAGAAAIPEMLRTLATECSHAILAPFDSGIPCTFYGYVCDRWTIHFGPFEALVYWDLRSGHLDAPGILWPLRLDREQGISTCRTVREVAERLHRETGYCGAFCADGVLQGRRYIIHEINPRVCAGFSLLTEMSGNQTSLSLVDLALRDCPACAENLRVPLERLADRIQVHEPTVRLWDPEHRALQDHLRARARNGSDIAGWVEEVRQSLAQEFRLPLVSQSPELPR